MRKRRNICFVIALLARLSFAQQVDSLLYQLDQSTGKDRIAILHKLVTSHALSHPTKALEFADEAYDLSIEYNDSINISKSLRFMAGVHYYKADYETSLRYNREALTLANQLQDKGLINNCYNNIGLIYYNLGNYPQALEYLMSSLNIKEEIGELYGKTTTMNNIGLIYERNNQFDQAREYFTQALDLARINSNENLIIYSLNNTGQTWLKQGQLETARVYFENGLKLAKQVNNINWGAASLRGLGEISQLQNDYENALSYYLQSLENTKSIEDKKGISESFQLLSKHYLGTGQTNKALSLLDSSQYYAVLIQSGHLIQANLKLYIRIHQLRQDSRNGVYYQDEYLHFRDSLYQDVIKRNLDLVPFKLEEEAGKLKMAEQQSVIDQRTFINRVYVIILLISVPLIAVLILLLGKIRTSNLKLRKKNEEIRSQWSEIEAQNLKLSHSIKQLRRTQNLLNEAEKMATLGQLVGGLAHELNNPLNYIGGILEPIRMNLKDIEKHSKDIKDLEAYQETHILIQGVKEGTERASSIIDKLKALSPKHRTQEEEHFDLSDCIEETIELLEKEYDRISFLNNLVVGPLPIRSNYYEITKILFAVINNAIHAVLKNVPNNRKVYLELRQSSDHYEIIIQDNGQGIDESEFSKIFTPFYTTKKESGASGLGLFVAQTLTERNGGSIRVESIKGQGSTFTIILPQKLEE
jgi:signal transduction histidine kinase